MPRTRRRRANDRRRDAEQRRIASEALTRARSSKEQPGRYVQAVLRPRVGEVVAAKDGGQFEVEEDGSLRRLA
jgi:hypothetical protein